MLFRIAHHDNKTLFWHVAITRGVLFNDMPVIQSSWFRSTIPTKNKVDYSTITTTI